MVHPSLTPSRQRPVGSRRLVRHLRALREELEIERLSDEPEFAQSLDARAASAKRFPLRGEYQDLPRCWAADRHTHAGDRAAGRRGDAHCRDRTHLASVAIRGKAHTSSLKVDHRRPPREPDTDGGARGGRTRPTTPLDGMPQDADRAHALPRIRPLTSRARARTQEFGHRAVHFEHRQYSRAGTEFLRWKPLSRTPRPVTSRPAVSDAL
jgi:hypothetical protein